MLASLKSSAKSKQVEVADDMAKQLKELRPRLKKIGHDLKGISMSLSIPPSFTATVVPLDDPPTEEEIKAAMPDDEDKMGKAGKALFAAIRSSKKMREKMLERGLKLASMSVVLSLPPAIDLEFEVNDN
eukprot:TRINITY_DN66083_c4_g1_i1.p1 TRINITY_DN66083_c4_g1~~TRINITY_DN66083_c4_g1_i1.p1  ORF type:complete len:129 (-),score=75.77 TRINITY_DN66083_c4_g1_i1:157-543(-)